MTYNKFDKRGPSRKPYVKKERQKQGLTVEVRYPPDPSEEQITKSFVNAMRKFKKLINDEGIIQTYRENQFYAKPSIGRAKAKAMAKKRWAKKKREIIQERGF